MDAQGSATFSLWENKAFAVSFLLKSHSTLFLHVGLFSPILLNPRFLEKALLYPNKALARRPMMDTYLLSHIAQWCSKTIFVPWSEQREGAWLLLLSRIRNRDLKWKQLRRKKPSQKQDPAGGGQAR